MTRYLVTGGSDTFGYAPGQTFDADLPEAQERRLIGRGSIQRVSAPRPPKHKTATKEANDAGSR